MTAQALSRSNPPANTEHRSSNAFSARRAGRKTRPPRGAAFGGVPSLAVIRPGGGTGDRGDHEPHRRSWKPSARLPVRWPTGSHRGGDKDLHRRRLIGQRPETMHCGAFDEQLHGSRVKVQRGDQPQLLVGNAQTFPAGGQDLHRGRVREDGLDKIGDGVATCSQLSNTNSRTCPPTRRPPTRPRSYPAVE